MLQILCQLGVKTMSEVVPYLAVSISWRFSWFKSHSEPKVSDDCGQIVSQHHILALEVPGKFQDNFIKTL